MEPGPYKIQFRGLSLGELWRFSGFNPGCVTLRNGHDMEFMDNNNYMDAPGIVTNTPIKEKGVEAVDRALVAFLAKPGTEARRFGSFAEWRDFAKEQALRVWDARVARGLARKER